MNIRYSKDDKVLKAREFICFANQVWPGDYDEEKTESVVKISVKCDMFRKSTYRCIYKFDA